MLRRFTLISAAAAALGGCANYYDAKAQSAGDLLLEAGFQQVVADTPERVRALKEMKPRDIQLMTSHGENVWVYADPTYCGCIYVGNQTQYEEYQLLVADAWADREEKLKSEEPTPYDWGMYGPW